MRGHPTRAVRRLALIATTTAVVVAGFGATAAPSMAGDFRVATTTTLSASPSAIDAAGSTTLTASVRPGLLVGPIGNVKFTDTTNGTLLGTIRPRLECLLKRQPCVATLTVPASALAAGNNTIVAAYSGGLFTKPSSGSTDVFVGTTKTCASGSGTCSTSTTSADGSTSATITTTPGAQTETVQAFFDTETPPCTVVGAGDTLVYSVTNPGDMTKTVSLTLTGQAAIDENTLAGKFGNVCFGSPTSFATDDGSASGGTATLGSDGLYYGNLPLCDDGKDNDNDYPGESGGHTVVSIPPCINPVDASADTWATYTQDSPPTYTESFTTTAGDPKAHG